MRSFGGLFSRIVDMSNLALAARKARRGKSRRSNVSRFELDREKELMAIRDELVSKTYRPGPYRTFTIHEPKERLISAAPYRDRVVHHALCNVIEPILDRRMIFDTYANRQGKGTHRALDRFHHFLRASRYVLKCDVAKFFPSIDHEILLDKVERVIRCPETLWLIRVIVDGSNPQEPVVQHFPGDGLLTPLERRRGLPIGNLTSQLLANFYLDGLDHFVKEVLGVRRYVRYVDDFALLADGKAVLRDARAEIAELLGRDRLKLHARKSRIYSTGDGVEFVGFRVYPDRRCLKRAGVRRFQKRMAGYRTRYATGHMGLETIRGSIGSWLAHAAHGDTRALVGKVLAGITFVRGDGRF